MKDVKYAHLLGRPFEHGVTDCYSIVRDFYKDNFGVELTNYARPDDWWVKGANLYIENFEREGFRVINVPTRDIQIGDCFLIAIPDPRAPDGITPTNHVAIYVGEGMVIHHLLGRESRLVPYKGMLRNFTTHIVRHNKVGELTKISESTLDIRDYLLPHKRRMIDDALSDS